MVAKAAKGPRLTDRPNLGRRPFAGWIIARRWLPLSVAAAIASVAAAPYLGVTAVSSWMGFILLSAAAEVLFSRIAPSRAWPGDLMELLCSCSAAAIGFALLALQEVFPAILAVVIWGTISFRAVVLEYRRPRHLAIAVGPQAVAAAWGSVEASIRHVWSGTPELVIPEIAVAILALSAMLSIYAALQRRRQGYQNLLFGSREKARQVAEAHRVAMLAEQLGGSGHFRMDLRTLEFRTSAGLCELYGLSEGDQSPRPEDLLSRYEEPEREKIAKMVSQVVRTRSPARLETRLRLKSGQEKYILSQTNPEFDESGDLTAIFGLSFDVTEAHRREAELAESEARLRLLADNVTDIILWVDPDARVLYASPSVSSFGYVPEELTEHSLTDFFEPEDHDEVLQLMDRALKEVALETELRGEFRFLSRDRPNQTVWLEGYARTIRNPAGLPQSVVINFRDVTRRRELERDLREAKLRAEAAMEAKSEFLANMSHEIRTPLTGVIGFSEILSRTSGLPPKAEGYVQKVITNGEALLSVVNDILDFSKLEAGQVRLDPGPVSVRDFLQEIRDLFALQVSAKGLGLHIDVDDETPDYVLADRGRLRQVLNNLMSNAVKFTDTGSIQVGVHYDAERSALTISVRDTGIGIPAGEEDKLFERFTQTDSSITRRFGGTGLGLSICRQLTHLMGGGIRLDPTPGQGTTFTFDVLAPPCELPEVITPEKGLGFVDSSALRILVVDDLDTNRELVRVLLEATGQIVEEAASGSQAISLAMRTPYDIIFMDLQMPGMDGFATSQAIRQLASENRTTPIIALSANVMAEHVLEAEQAGMNDHVNKPIVTARLFETLNRWAGVRIPLEIATNGLPKRH